MRPVMVVTQSAFAAAAMLSRGRSYPLIAAELGLRHKTVQNMSSKLKLKLGVRCLPELILKAVKLLSGRI
jgi:DNA-binding NarL/FixJ family response regulator